MVTELVNKKLVERRVIPGFPNRTEYQLTDENGQRLRPLLIELYRTGLTLQQSPVGDLGRVRRGRMA